MEYLISRVIAGGLALVDALLGQWVTVQATTSGTNVDCMAANAYVAVVNGCGQQMLEGLASVINGVVFVLPQILAGLFAQTIVA